MPLAGEVQWLKCSIEEVENLSSISVKGQLDFIQLHLEETTTVGGSVKGYIRISRQTPKKGTVLTKLTKKR